jgi:hypothetical protein
LKVVDNNANASKFLDCAFSFLGCGGGIVH